MKSLLLMISLFVCGIANAKTYYFSTTSGNDSRTSAEAQNPATPWKTISKLNSFSSTLVAGDNVFFQRGDVFYGSISINKSGTLNDPITIGAYGTGADPLVTGFTSISSWTNLGSNIWESTSAVTTLSECNIISIEDINTAYGRMPKTGYSTIQNASPTSISDDINLNASTRNWTGANVVSKTARWHLDRAVITSASGGTINFSAGMSYDPAVGWGYFIQNHPACLTQQNDWCFIPASKKIRIWSTTQPDNVKIPTVNYGAYMNFDYITFDNIDFTGFNIHGIDINGQTGITAQHCNFYFIAHNGIINETTNGSDLTVSNCTFKEINSGGINTRGMENSLVQNNTFKNIGNIPGMAGSEATGGDGNYTGIQVAANSQVLYNSLTNIGYNGITWKGSGTLIQGNFVNTFCYVKDDGGGIYTFPLGNDSEIETYANRRVVRDNICINAIGSVEGSNTTPYPEAACIYNDGNSTEVDYINNSMSSGYYGLFFHGGSGCTVNGNTIYNTTRGFHLVRYNNLDINNNTISNNIFTAGEGGTCQNGQYCAYYEPAASGLPASLTLSNNIYGRPLDQTNGWIWRDFNNGNICNSLEQWKSATGKDAGSTQSPITISDIFKMRFVYNETSVPKTISLGAAYIDMRSVTYAANITLQPFTSAVLLKTGTGNIPPIANAGTDLLINAPENISITGNGVDYDGTITSYNWTKISGPAVTILNATSPTVTLTGAIAGTYKFELKVSDNRAGIGKDTMTLNYGTIIVPVTLVNFTAIAKPNKSTLLQWTTATEINSDHFLVERSSNGTNFTQVGSVNASGNTSTTIAYQLTDYFPETGMNYYRLKMVDRDGQFKYSETIIVTFKNTNSGSFNIISTSSFSDRFQINMNSTKIQQINIALYDATGKLFYSTIVLLQKGINNINKSMLLPDQVYYLRISNNEEKISLPLLSIN